MPAKSRQQALFGELSADPALGDIERWAYRSGNRILIGTDEAGRGPLAGPVVAAAVCLAQATQIDGLNDSKQLSPAMREALFPQICAQARCWAAAFVMPAEIDRINILQASRYAMKKALKLAEQRGGLTAELWLIDGNSPLETLRRQQTVIKGDSRSTNIAAASVIAKVLRDRWMVLAERRYPGYGFAAHKGYGTRAHLAALQKLGPCPLHRKSYAPVARLLAR